MNNFVISVQCMLSINIVQLLYLYIQTLLILQLTNYKKQITTIRILTKFQNVLYDTYNTHTYNSAM